MKGEKRGRRLGLMKGGMSGRLLPVGGLGDDVDPDAEDDAVEDEAEPC